MKRLSLVLFIIILLITLSSCSKSSDVLGFADFGGSDTVLIYYSSETNTVYAILTPAFLGISSPTAAQDFTERSLDFYAYGNTDDFNKLKIIISSILNKDEAISTHAFITDLINALATKNSYFTNSEISKRIADFTHTDISKLVSVLGMEDVNIEVINSYDFISQVDLMYAYNYFKIWFSQIK